jgi:hypothetical protein
VPPRRHARSRGVQQLRAPPAGRPPERALHACMVGDEWYQPHHRRRSDLACRRHQPQQRHTRSHQGGRGTHARRLAASRWSPAPSSPEDAPRSPAGSHDRRRSR